MKHGKVSISTSGLEKVCENNPEWRGIVSHLLARARVIVQQTLTSVDSVGVKEDAPIVVRLEEGVRAELKVIHEALSRIIHGNYGHCQSCSSPIGLRVLEQTPWMSKCEECNQRESSISGAPVYRLQRL